jgi:hypothetical protein
MKWVGLFLLTVGVVAAWPAYAGQGSQAPAGPLRIIVLEGEAAVNIIQQGTAVAPVVEVRDRNNLPVAGAVVQFTIARTSNAAVGTFANGQTTLTVTTNAAGRAAASQLRPVGRGAMRIQVEARFQGQAATATITQQNVPTQADAAQLRREPAQQSGGSSAAAGGAASTAGLIAGAAAAAVTGVTAVKHLQEEPSCQSQGDRALAAVTVVANSCPVGSTSAQCTQAGADAAESLGAWCACSGGRTQLEAELSLRGSSVADLQREAALRSVTFPNACR